MTDGHTHIQIIVTYTNAATLYYKVPPDQGWRFDTTHRQLVIGRGTPRVHVPLDNVLGFEPAPYECKDPSCLTLLSTAFKERWRTGSKSTPVQWLPSTDLSPSAPTSRSSDKSMSLRTEWGTVLTTTSGYLAALQRIGSDGSTPWSDLGPTDQLTILGHLVYHGHVISSSPHPPAHRAHPVGSCPQCIPVHP